MKPISARKGVHTHIYTHPISLPKKDENRDDEGVTRSAASVKRVSARFHTLPGRVFLRSPCSLCQLLRLLLPALQSPFLIFLPIGLSISFRQMQRCLSPLSRSLQYRFPEFRTCLRRRGGHPRARSLFPRESVTVTYSIGKVLHCATTVRAFKDFMIAYCVVLLILAKVLNCD